MQYRHVQGFTAEQVMGVAALAMVVGMMMAWYAPLLREVMVTWDTRVADSFLTHASSQVTAYR